MSSWKRERGKEEGGREEEGKEENNVSRCCGYCEGKR
jgi:hypothetical protein